ncbi:hypothetical protein AAFF_G00357190 [Aldrovandia affinis]|uniref:Uncharacterized protein n=1 Tax=Aldrovandia affinis TaxID=143900 RepID=A0AAD7T8N8_9TELE|nr:hypothetical protein AAFF_G00357190 [Aldrovandia affinis]
MLFVSSECSGPHAAFRINAETLSLGSQGEMKTPSSPAVSGRPEAASGRGGGVTEAGVHKERIHSLTAGCTLIRETGSKAWYSNENSLLNASGIFTSQI